MTKFAKFQLVLAVTLISVGMFFGGFYFGKRGYVYEIRKNPPRVEITNRYPGDQEVDFGLFWEIWDLVNAQYLERPIDAQELTYGAIKGMVEALGDPYSSFLKPEINQSFLNELNSTYQGIGAELAIRDGNLVVVAPLDGSPAEEAGVRAGDKILEIEGASTVGLSMREAVSKIRGDAGTIVTLTLQRDNGAPFVSTIKRGNITMDSVTWEDKGNGSIYIRVSRFGEQVSQDWNKVVSEISANAPEVDAIIIDLRGNPGGIINGAQYISEEFYTGKDAFYTEDALGNQIPYPTKRIGSFEDIPAVFVLIDQGSASAAEILAASLRVNAGATLVGKTSFGKGTMQSGYDMKDRSSVHITTAKWLTADKQWIHGVGLAPDVDVELTSQDINEGNDTQLNRALELAEEY